MKDGVTFINRRTALKTSVALASALAIPAIARAQARKIVIGASGIGLHHLPLFLAISNKYFADHGLDVEFVNVQSGARARQALAAQQILVAFGAVSNALALTKAGKESAIIFLSDRKMAWVNLLVRKEDFESGRITSPRNLGGHSVAVTQPLSADWASIMQLAEGAKVTSAPDFIYAGDLSSILASLKSGRVDTAIAMIEAINQAEAEGWAKAIFTGSDDAAWNEYMGGDVAGNGAFVLRETLERDSALLQDVVSSVTKSTDFIFGNSVQAIADIVHPQFFESYDRKLFESALSIYQKSFYSKTNMLDREQYARILEIFGRDRLFSVDDTKQPGFSYDQAVDMSFVERARRG